MTSVALDATLNTLSLCAFIWIDFFKTVTLNKIHSPQSTSNFEDVTQQIKKYIIIVQKLGNLLDG
jgi:hypothetical protein